jgi:hypothetical protein
MKTTIIALILALSACGTSTTPPPTTGCVETTPPTTEMFVQKRFDCQDTYVYTFGTTEARDHWKQIAKEFGVVPIASGDTWLTVKR